MKWFLLFFLFSNLYAADSCSDRINQNEAVNLNNVRNQDSVGWCYAYSAADLLSYKYNKRISAVSLYNSEASIEDELFNPSLLGEDVRDSILSYYQKNHGFCLEDDLPSSDFLYCADYNYASFLQELLQTSGAGKMSQCLEGGFYSTFPNINIDLLKNNFSKKNLIEYLNEQSCQKNRMKVSRPFVTRLTVPETSKSVQMNKIDELLNANNIVSVGVNFGSLNAAKPGDHAMTVVGRRKNPESGECEFLVRNSWGADCSEPEGNGVSCHKICEGKDSKECRYSGHLWISKKRLEDALIGVAYLP